MPDANNVDSNATNHESKEAALNETNVVKEPNPALSDEMKAYVKSLIQESINPLASTIRKLTPKQEATPDRQDRTKIERIEALEKALEEATKRQEAEKDKSNKKLIHSSLINSANKHGVGADRTETLIDSLLHKHSGRFLVEDDSINVKDEFDEKKSISLDEFVSSYVKKNSWLIPATSVPSDKGLKGENKNKVPAILSRQDLASGKFSTADIRANK